MGCLVASVGNGRMCYATAGGVGWLPLIPGRRASHPVAEHFWCTRWAKYSISVSARAPRPSAANAGVRPGSARSPPMLVFSRLVEVAVQRGLGNAGLGGDLSQAVALQL